MVDWRKFSCLFDFFICFLIVCLFGEGGFVLCLCLLYVYKNVGLPVCRTICNELTLKVLLYRIFSSEMGKSDQSQEASNDQFINISAKFKSFQSHASSCFL